jgi:hypothetical protein
VVSPPVQHDASLKNDVANVSEDIAATVYLVFITATEIEPPSTCQLDANKVKSMKINGGSEWESNPPTTE